MGGQRGVRERERGRDTEGQNGQENGDGVRVHGVSLTGTRETAFSRPTGNHTSRPFVSVAVELGRVRTRRALPVANKSRIVAKPNDLVTSSSTVSREREIE